MLTKMEQDLIMQSGECSDILEEFRRLAMLVPLMMTTNESETLTCLEVGTFYQRTPNTQHLTNDIRFDW